MTHLAHGEPLTAVDVSWSVDGRHILDGVGVEVPVGSFTGLLGPNGSGKSTLLRGLARLGDLDEGVVHIGPDNVHELPRRALARRLAFLEQRSDTDVDLSVLDVVLLGRTPYRTALRGDSPTDVAIATHQLEQVDLADLAHRRWHTLSGGEQQRVHLARALTQEPSLLVLDEPTNHLDVGHALQLLAMVEHSGLTVLAALHDLNLAAAFCDHLVVLHEGRVVAAGTPEEVLTPALLAEVYGVEADVTTHPTTGRLHLWFHPPSVPH
ncbi:ABC transporter ATP-binding protein [Spiractinospora alimapuensis]|uniref:ABC transporter ATP-binding protein n=1 Tax=Spiractinospora alimapuensis TaxID=2820884 RepID=UPI001F2CFC8B|nr:ABC transporter ATP-binding protein [Spiractinospora alimapuensis]QVQ52688.1 ABC transporter ATP-binding protein [Spiractinospora alimapuensis]